MVIFWIWRQISQIGLPVAPRSRRHLLFNTSLGVRRRIFGVFMKKIERDKTNFLAPIKKSFFCLCQFRLFFFFLTFTGGNPWPNTVPANPFGRKSGVFFASKLKKFFVYWHLSVIPAPNFSFFLGLPSIKVSSFLDRTVCRRTRVPQVACCCWEVAFFFYFFCRLSWNVLCSIHLKLLKSSKF